MSHQTTVPITWGDTDAGGLIYYPRAFHFLVVALNDYFSPVSNHLMEQLRADGYVLPVAEASASFTAPLRAGDMAQVKTDVDAGETSLTVAFSIVRESDETTAVEGDATFILVNDDFEPVPLPEFVRECIKIRQ